MSVPGANVRYRVSFTYEVEADSALAAVAEATPITTHKAIMVGCEILDED